MGLMAEFEWITHPISFSALSLEQQLTRSNTLTGTMKRPGLSRPKQPLHPNRANAVLLPARPLPARVSTSSTTAPLTPLTSRRRSPSPSASPSSPRVSRTVTSPLTLSPIRSEQVLEASPPVWRSLLLLSTPSPPPDASTLPLPPPLAVHPSPPSPVNPSVAPRISAQAAATPVHAPGPHPRPPCQWTLAEVIERCTTWEEYLQHRPIGFSALSESWAVLDAAMRKRHYKQPREPWPVVFTRVRSNTESRLSSTEYAYLVT